MASPGRFGPYLKRSDADTRSLSAEEQLFTVTLEEAEALYAQPKLRRGRQQKPPLAELGANPDNGQPVRVLEGRYGVYVTDGNVNRRCHAGSDPSALTLDEAVGLLRARAEAGPAKKAKKVAKKAAKKTTKTTAKKTAKSAAKKPREGRGQESREKGDQHGRRTGGRARLVPGVTRRKPRLVDL